VAAIDGAGLVFEWNGDRPASQSHISVNDETLRDGLQAPSAREPSDELKRRLVHLMAAVGVDAVTIGFPAAGRRMYAQCRLLTAEVAASRLPLSLTCAARARESDLGSIVELSNAAGLAIEAGAFIGTSALRHATLGLTLDETRTAVAHAVGFGVRNGLPVMFVAEDGSRAHPDTLAALCRTAIHAGARRICLADTAGYATPAGTARLVRFVREQAIAPCEVAIPVDWHGHRDRGLALANALAAIGAGADRVHATALGIGERAGNTEMELVLGNLYLLGRRRGDLARLPEYCRTAAAALGILVPPHHPIVGPDAFRTGTGTHAAAIADAIAAGDDRLADLLYSSLPATWFGLRQGITLSPASGRANARWWLASHGHDPDDGGLAAVLLRAAKAGDRTLTEEECAAIVAEAVARIAVPD
jgi:2-isopropylmalate synthase